MKSKLNKHRHTQDSEPYLLDEHQIEERARQIAKSEGRDTISETDRTRAWDELLPPTQMPYPVSSSQSMAWEELTALTGRQYNHQSWEDSQSIGEVLFEHGLRQPRGL